jgi:uncharacterized integral membrane protein
MPPALERGWLVEIPSGVVEWGGMKTIAISVGVGMVAAVLLTTFFNQNCGEYSSGCIRLNPAVMLIYGVFYGAIIGAIIAFVRWLRRRRAARREFNLH